MSKGASVVGVICCFLFGGVDFFVCLFVWLQWEEEYAK